MNGRLYLEEVLDHVFDAVCRMLLAYSMEPKKGRNIPSTESSGIGAMSNVEGEKVQFQRGRR